MAKQLCASMSMHRKVLSLPLGGKVLTFVHSSEREHQLNKITSPESVAFFKSSQKFYIQEPRSSDRVKNCLDLRAFRDVLTQRLADTGAAIYSSCTSYPSGTAGDTPESCRENTFSRGLIISCESNLCPDNAERILRETMCKGEYAINHYVKYTAMDNLEWLLLTIKGSNSTILEQGVLCAAHMPMYHPAYTQPGNSALFHSYKDAKNVMLQIQTEKARCFLRKIESLTEKKLDDGTSLDRHHPLVVIEGLDGTGKSTLSKTLSENINGVDFHTPSEDLQLWRPYFDQYPELIRRAYFTLCSYASANQIAQELQKTPIVIDRYWHTTAAYTMATDVSPWGVSVLPPKGHWVYRWPSDLLRPSVVLYLYASEAVRCQRLKNRDDGLTPEELKLSQLPALRDTLDQAYRRMENPHVTVIDASGSREDVLQKSLKAVSPYIKS